MAEQDPRSRGVYGITTAAELSGVAVPTLRLYERKGLVTPDRTEGGTRRYSEHDLALLQRISDLVDARVNLVGITHVLALQDANAMLTTENDELDRENTRLRAEQEHAVPTDPLTSDLRDDVPEPDLLDQRTPVEPDDTGGPAAELRWDTDPADAHDQAAVVELDDDAHPRVDDGTADVDA